MVHTICTGLLVFASRDHANHGRDGLFCFFERHAVAIAAAAAADDDDDDDDDD